MESPRRELGTERRAGLAACLGAETEREGLLRAAVVDDGIACGLTRGDYRLVLPEHRAHHGRAPGTAAPRSRARGTVHTLAEAAKAVKRDKSTLLRAVRRGRLSATRDADG